jgi:hypothetical protein
MRLSRQRNSRTITVATCVAMTAAAAAVGIQAAANADTSQRPQRDRTATVVVQSNAHGKVLTAAPWVTDKNALVRLARPTGVPRGGQPAIPQRGQAAARLSEQFGTQSGGVSHADRNQWLYPSGRTSVTPPQGRPADLVATGSSYVYVPYLNYYASFTQSSSRVAWLGSAPLVADSIQHTDQWHADFFGISFVAKGAPEGATTKSDASSVDVQWTTTVNKNWYSEHAWDRVDFMPTDWFGQLYRIRHTVTGVFQFGSSFYTVEGDGRAFVW